MKYGDQLRQHSVPEWAYYNVDYDAVKHLIKECTSSGKGKALDIPGEGQDAKLLGEKRLYHALLLEHERVELFVKSKSNEIQGRLTSLERSLKQLRSRNNGFNADSPRPYLKVRYVKLEHGAIATGEEIQSLSRFIVAQRTAFRKLLKKYRKWSGSATLGVRFDAEVLDKPSSFTHVSLGEQFERWKVLLQAIRAAQKPAAPVTSTARHSDITRSRAEAEKPQENSAAISQQFAHAVHSMNDGTFDAAFSEIPMGETGKHAVFWVHSEQLIELQVLLLQHVRLYITKPNLEPTSSFSQSPVISRRSSMSWNSKVAQESDSGVIYLDQPENYGQRQSTATVNDSESQITASPTRAAVAARWTTSVEDAVVSFRSEKYTGRKGMTRLRRKHLGAFLDTQRDFQPWKTAGQALPVDNESNFAPADVLSTDEAYKLLGDKKDIEPLVALLSKRTRFVGLANTATAGQWATLDAQITFKKVAKDDLAGKDWMSNVSRNTKNFPFAVLRIRQEGELTRDLIEVLEQSHLTERVRGFSLPGHAIWECWRPRGMTAPFWLSAMDKDIRKVPAMIDLGRRRSSQLLVAEHGQKSSTSSNSEYGPSGSSTAIGAESSATSAPDTPILERDNNSGLQTIQERKKKAVTIDEADFDRPSRRKRKETRYWSEYDNPSDDDTNAFYIYIDPDKEEKWLGQETAQKISKFFRTIFSKEVEKDVPDEERGLLGPLTEVEDDDGGSSSSDTEGPAKTLQGALTRKQKRNGYGTLPSSQRKPSVRLANLLVPSVETAPTTSARLLITTISLAASAILCVLILTLAMTGRKKQKGEVDAGVLLGVVASLFFALVGLTSVLTARENIGLVNWAIIGGVFCAVCVVDGVLVGWVLV